MNQQIERAQTENTFIRRKSISMNNLNIDSDTLQHLRQLNKQYQTKKEPSTSTENMDKYKNYQPATSKNDPVLKRVTQQDNKLKRMDSINLSASESDSVSNNTDSQVAQQNINKVQDEQFYNQQREVAAQFNIKDLKSLHSAS